MKFKSKQYADASRNAKMSEVKQGDLVLLKQDKKNKLSPTFGTSAVQSEREERKSGCCV